MIRVRGISLGAAFCICACSPKADLSLGERVADRFHSQYRAGQFAEIYKGVDSEFASSAKAPEFVKYEQLVRDKLGSLKSFELTNYNVMYVLGKSEVRLDYEAVFEKGKAQETFEVSVRKGNAALSGYRIDSPLLPKSE